MLMDEHVRRVTAPLLDAWIAFEAEQSISLLDLSRLCRRAADALDNNVNGIPIVLDRACVDLKYAYRSTERTGHLSEARRILEPVIASLEPDLQGQTFCDWCYRPLSAKSVTASREIGLANESSFACESCVEVGAFWNPPEGLEYDAVWPVDRFRPPRP
jgi:hypothetical protein